MYFSDEDIKKELIENWEQLEGSAYPEDLVSQFADGATPVYYSDIVSDWFEMGRDYQDEWQEFGYQNEGIMGLMSVDVNLYYQTRYSAIFVELKEEKEEVA